MRLLALLAALALALILPLCGCAALSAAQEAAEAARDQVEELAREFEAGQQSAREIHEAYKRGELTAAEREEAIAQLRAELIDGFTAVKESLQATGDALSKIKPEDLAREAIEGVAPLLPEPWGSLLAMLGLLGAGGATVYARKTAKAEGDRAVELSTGVPARMLHAQPTTRPVAAAILSDEVQRDLAAAREAAARTAAHLGTTAIRRQG